MKGGVKSDDHAVIYMSKDPKASPPAVQGENLGKSPIRVVPKSHRDKLDVLSRVNYAKIYTVEHNVKVWFIGEIAPESIKTFMVDFDQAWSAKRHMSSYDS